MISIDEIVKFNLIFLKTNLSNPIVFLICSMRRQQLKKREKKKNVNIKCNREEKAI